MTPHYKAFAIAIHASPRSGTKTVHVKKVQKGGGPSCTVTLDYLTNRVIDVRGEVEPYFYFMNNHYGKTLGSVPMEVH